MGKQKLILVVIEPDNKPHVVIERATWLAKLMNYKIELLLCDPMSNPLLIGIIPSAKSSELERAVAQVQLGFVNELAEIARDQGVVVNTEVANERPIAEAVMSRARAYCPAFVMKGTHYHSDAERGIIVDTDWQLVRTCRYPIWLVKAEKFSGAPVIVASVDPTHSHDKPAALDDAIVRMAKSVASPTGGEVHLFHTYERFSGVGDKAMKVFRPVKLDVEKIEKAIKEEHRMALDALALKNEIGEKFVHQLPGRTRDLLPAFVRSKKAQLVVMGALARWGFKRMIIGSTAERVMDHLPCDIIIVRSGR
ncbi:MAG: universal stress protein [Proteobacteria bacterium]|nr:universal stress protein [Pseudomonadota bacterium]MDA0993832.1 universal stress protein [Pseudomonadota bacterium]